MLLPASIGGNGPKTADPMVGSIIRTFLAQP